MQGGTAQPLEPWVEEILGRLGEMPLLDDLPDEEAGDVEAKPTPPWLTRLRELMEVRGVPFREGKIVTSGKLIQTKALDLLDSWQAVCSRVYGGLLVASAKYGRGKTVMATKAVIDGPQRGFPWGGSWPRGSEPKFIAASSLAFMSPYQSDAFDDLLKPSVLAIDDCGTEYADGKGMLRAKINHIVTLRARAPCWTVITTNLDFNDFVTRFGDRIAARIQDPGSVFRVIDDRDYRADEENRKGA